MHVKYHTLSVLLVPLFSNQSGQEQCELDGYKGHGTSCQGANPGSTAYQLFDPGHDNLSEPQFSHLYGRDNKMENSGEVISEKMKRWNQSKNNTQLWMLLVMEVKSDAVENDITQEPEMLGP